MNTQIFLSLLCKLLENRRVTANELAAEYGVSPRTVYRYIDRLSKLLPLRIQRGRAGGITLADSYKLPVGFLKEEEYEAAITALEVAYAHTAEERFLTAKRKIARANKEDARLRVAWASPNEILLLLNGELSKILPLLQTGIREKRVLHLMLTQENDRAETLAEPYFLTYRNNAWELFFYCLYTHAFRSLPLAALRGVSRTEKYFQPRPFEGLPYPPCTN